MKNKHNFYLIEEHPFCFNCCIRIGTGKLGVIPSDKFLEKMKDVPLYCSQKECHKYLGNCTLPSKLISKPIIIICDKDNEGHILVKYESLEIGQYFVCRGELHQRTKTQSRNVCTGELSNLFREGQMVTLVKNIEIKSYI